MSDDQPRVRLTPQFLDDVDALFDRDRSGGKPSRADFHNEDLPLLVQLLAEDFERNTFEADSAGQRMLIRESKFGGYLVLYTCMSDTNTVELVGLEFDEPPAATYD